MTEESSFTPGIHWLPEPCWTIVTPDGSGAGFEEAEDHYPDRAAAEKALPSYGEHDQPLRAVPLVTHCTVGYLLCGAQFIHDGESLTGHFADAETTLDLMALDGHTLVSDDVYACLKDDCERCAPHQLRAQAGQVADKLTELAKVVLDLGEVERVTLHPDQERRESVTTHTVMLGIVGCAIAARFYPDLDLGVIAQRALVHDLVEAIPGVGDTPTLRQLNPDESAAKDERERKGAFALHLAFTPSFPWLIQQVGGYMQLKTREDRFVKLVDKHLPKLVAWLSGCREIHDSGMTVEKLTARLEGQRVEMAAYGSEFPEMIALHKVLGDRVVARLADEWGA